VVAGVRVVVREPGRLQLAVVQVLPQDSALAKLRMHRGRPGAKPCPEAVVAVQRGRREVVALLPLVQAAVEVGAAQSLSLQVAEALACRWAAEVFRPDPLQYPPHRYR